MDLIEFLRARLDDDEQIARTAAGQNADGSRTWPSWSYDRDNFLVQVGDSSWFAAQKTGDADGEHIARHDPARVLADVDAKRRIIETYRKCLHMCAAGHETAYSQGELGAYESAAKLLALSYAAHPDYDEAWRP